MPDFIDREAVYVETCRGCSLHGDEIGSCFAVEPCERLRRGFVTAPAAAVAPVVHGEWETVPNREFDGFETVIRGEAERCTNCCRASKDFKKWFSICPNCGAKMDGGADGAVD